MSMSDPIADMLTRIRNGSKARHRYVQMQWSKLKQHIAEILKENGFIEEFHKIDENKKQYLRVYLKYGARRTEVFNGLKRVSKPGNRVYVRSDQVKPFFGKLGLSILSTSKGVMESRKAQEARLGGELLCRIW